MESKSRVQTDYLIVGQGLAGSLIALNLLERGKTVLVIDDGHEHAASKVAAGLINPITGRRHALTWRFLECWNYLQDDYAKWEQLLGSDFIYEMPILRFLRSEEERLAFEKKFEAGEFEGIGISYPAGSDDVPGCIATEPAYRLSQTGFVDQSQFINCSRRYLKSRASLVKGTWEVSEFSRKKGIVQWMQFQASNIIFTQGFKIDENPYFNGLPFRHAKGEIVELAGAKYDGLPVLNRGKWLLHSGDGRYRAGATYDLKQLDQEISDEGIGEIMKGVTELVNWDLEVLQVSAGVRPALHDFKPVLGKHPWYPELVIFNGLGSKGSLQAPLLAKELVDHLESGALLHPQVDIERFRKYL